MPNSKALRILIVEDEPTDAAILRRSLQRLEIPALEIALAESGARAKELLNSQSFDLVLLDLHLPDVVGYELVHEAKRLRGDLPVIVCTSINSDEAALQVGKIGADDFIVKDDLLGSSLARTVRRLLHHRLREAIPASGGKAQKLIEEPSDRIDSWLAWKFPEEFVPPGEPPAAVLEEARARYVSILNRAAQSTEAELRNAMLDFETFAYDKRLPAESLIKLHREWSKEQACETVSGHHRYLLFEILAALVERYREAGNAAGA